MPPSCGIASWNPRPSKCRRSDQAAATVNIAAAWPANVAIARFAIAVYAAAAAVCSSFATAKKAPNVSTRRPWFKFYADDFLVGVLGMTDAEIGVYIRLLAIQWAKGPLSPELVRQAGRTATVRRVLASKFDATETAAGPRWTNAKLESVRGEAGPPAPHPPGKPPADQPPADRRRDARVRGGQSRARKAKRGPGGQFAKGDATTPEPVAQLAEHLGRAARPRNPDPEPNTRSKFERTAYAAVEAPDWEPLALAFARRIVSTVGPPANYRDRQLIAQAAIVAATTLDERWLADALAGIAETSPRRPLAALQTILRERAETLHAEDFDALAQLIPVPRRFYELIRRYAEPRTATG